MPKILADKIIFSGEDWTDGLNSQYSSTALISGNVIASSSSMNPYRPNGIAGPGYLASDTTNISSITGLIVSGVNKYNSGSSITKAILLQGSGGIIQELTYLTNTITNGGGTFPHTIDHGHNTETGEDIVAYSVGSTKYAFYSFRDAADWDIGRYDYSTTFIDNYMSNTPTTPLGGSYITGGKDAPHPMIVGSDDLLYIGDRNFLHGFDGQATANGTFYAAVLTLPQGYIITSFAKTPDFLVLFAYRQDQTDTDGSTTGQAAAFFWDYLSLDPTYTYDIDDNYVNGGFIWNNTIGCFSTGRPTEQWLGIIENKRSDLRVFDGKGFKSVASFDGAVPIYRGVDVVSDEIMWNTEGTVFSYAEKIKNKGFRLNKITTSTSGSSSGFLKTMTGTQQYISAGASISGGLQFLSFTGFSSNSSLKTIYFDVPTNIGSINRVKAVEIHLYTLGNTGNTLVLSLQYLGNSTGEQVVVSEDVFSKYNVQYKQAADGSPFLSFNRLGLQMAWSLSDTTSSPPRVDSVIIYYEPVNI